MLAMSREAPPLTDAQVDAIPVRLRGRVG